MGHFIMAAMKQDPKTPPRKPLRQRVAERKAGIRPEESEKSIAWRKRLVFLANILQGVALIGLMIYVFEFVNRGMSGVNYLVVGVYVILFVIGRGLKIGIDIQKSARR